MEFSAYDENVINPFIKLFDEFHCAKEKLSQKEEEQYYSIIKSLYDDIKKSDNIKADALYYIFKKSGEIRTPPNFLKNESMDYIPNTIYAYIKKTPYTQLYFKCENIETMQVNIHFNLYLNDISAPNITKKIIAYYKNYVHIMCVWIRMCKKYASNSSHINKLNVYLYLTHFNKHIHSHEDAPKDGGIITSDTANTGLTNPLDYSADIIIYRMEEWFKVFIHESIHAFKLEQYELATVSEIKEKLLAVFPIKSEFNLYETYTEVWARIINCALCSFINADKSPSLKVFYDNIHFCLNLERVFSAFQTIKILNVFNIKYTELYHSKKLTAFKETTNAFAYYILSSFVLNDYRRFLIWCKNKNTVSIMKLNSNNGGLAFMSFILEKYNKPSMLKVLECNDKLFMSIINKKVPDILQTTTCMTLVNV